MSAETAAAGQLRAFVERIERLDEEIAGLNGDKRDLFAEAKGQGFDTKALKAVIGIRRKDPSERAELNAIVALYLSTLGMADAAGEVEQSDPRAHVQVQAHPRTREGEEIRRDAGGRGGPLEDAPEASGSPDEAGSSDGVESTPPGPATDTSASERSRDGLQNRAQQVQLLPPVPTSPERASEPSPAAPLGAQMDAVEPSPATDAAHESATPAAGSVGSSVRGGTLTSEPVRKSGVTVGGDESGTAAASRKSASDLGSGQVGERTAEPPRCHPSPGTGRESPGTLPPDREAAMAERLRQQRLNAKPLDPVKLGRDLFAVYFKARHLREPKGDEWVTGVPADASQVAA